MNTSKKYPWIKVVLGYSLLCPALGGVLLFPVFIVPNYIISVGIEEMMVNIDSLSFPSFADVRFSDLLYLVPLLFFAFGAVVIFGIPFLTFSLFFVGFKVHQGIWSYVFAVGWGVFLVVFVFVVLSPGRYSPDPDVIFDIRYGTTALGIAALLVTYWVVPPKDT